MRMHLLDENSSGELQKMQIAQYNEIELAQKIKATNKLTHRASVKLVETSEDETTPPTTPP